MFLLIGINPVKKVKDITLRRHCPHCDDIRNFREVQYRQFLSLFFIPILPLSKPGTVFSCVTCGYSISSEFAAQPVPEDCIHPTNHGDRAVILCPRCEGPMFVPIKDHRLNVTCPHCTMEFIIKGIKGEIPLASISNPQGI